jgi:hypothetical protein
LWAPCKNITSWRVKNLLENMGTKGEELHGECRIEGLKNQQNNGITMFSQMGNGNEGTIIILTL